LRKPHGTKRRPDILRKQLEGIEEEWADDDAYEESTGEAIGTATNALERFSEEERRLLRELTDWSRQASARPDAKAARLLAWLKETVRPGGKWNDERVIVFTEYRATQKWLHERFAVEGLAGQDRLSILYGGMDPEREHQGSVQAHPSQSSVRILLATDAASEGIDLQNHCHRVVHYEIPWNPNRLEQVERPRDRHGQRSNRSSSTSSARAGTSGQPTPSAAQVIWTGPRVPRMLRAR
jgi:superfamily II DNA/RNA helicase